MAQQKTLFGHPIGLFVLFFTEMWERFSYYGMRALLVLFMYKYLIEEARNNGSVLGFDLLESLVGGVGEPPQALASLIYGAYTFAVYMTPILGGIAADQFFGQKKTVIFGGIVMCIGHFMMAFDQFFILALILLIVGNGAFKPNISVQVGQLYPQGDPRRDNAFTFFYMGINLGAFIAPLICGTLGETYGWHYGFTAAGVGMALGLVVYLWGQKYLPQSSAQNLSQKKKASKKQKLNAGDYAGIGAIVVFGLVSVAFWAVFEQQGNSLQIFSSENTDWGFMGFQIPSTWLQSLNPLFIFIFAPILIWFWNLFGKKQLGSMTKMALGCVILGLGFVTLINVGASVDSDPTVKMSWLWFIPSIES